MMVATGFINYYYYQIGRTNSIQITTPHHMHQSILEQICYHIAVCHGAMMMIFVVASQYPLGLRKLVQRGHELSNIAQFNLREH